MNLSQLSTFAKKAAFVGAFLALSAPFAAFAAGPLTVTLTSTQPVSPATTAQNPIPVTATFSENVTNFAAGGVTVTNGSVTNFASTSGSVYTFGIVPQGNGAITVTLPAGQVIGNDTATTTSDNQIVFDSETSSASSTASSTPSQAFLSFSVFDGAPGASFNILGTNFASGEKVDVGFNGATTTATADISGNFSQPMTVPNLPAGNVQATAKGESSALVAVNTFFVNAASSSGSTSTTTASTTEGTSSGTNSPSLSITSGPAENSSTNQQAVTFAFTTDPTATTVCSFDVAGALNPTSFACGSPVILGSTVATSSELGDGQYTFTVTASNAGDTGSTTISRTFTVDTSVPFIAEVTPVPTPNNGTGVTYTFTSNKAGTASVTGTGCSLATTGNVANVGTSTVTFSTLASATYNCMLTVTDAAGNVSNTLTLTPFTVNAPAAPVTTSTGGGGGGGGGTVISGPLSIGYVNNTQSVPPTTPAVPQGGKVLGASTYNFTKSLSIGSSGEDVTQLQMVLIAGGFLSIASPTGYYGSLTAAAVKAYQGAHGLPQVGIVGPMTRAVLNQGSTGSTSTSGGQVKGASAYNFSANLSVGSTGADVTALQNALTSAGDYSGPITGYFGSLTMAAVKTYQTSKGISATGFVGPLTRASLNQGM